MASRGLDFCVSSTSFQKNDIGWPQQPPTEKVLKFNMIFYDSTKKVIFSKNQNKAEFKNLDDSEVLSSDFPDLRTSAASMTSTASTTSMASMTFTASFHQKHYWLWWLDHPWHQNDQYWSLFVEWIIKSPIFHWYLVFFLLGAVEATIFHNRTMKSLLQCAMQSLSSWVRRDMIYLIFMTDSPLLFSCSWTHSRK